MVKRINLLSYWWLFGMNKTFCRKFNKLKEKFLTRLEKIANFKYIYQNLVQKNDCVCLDQQLCNGEIKEIVVPKSRKMSKDSPLTADEAWQLTGLAEPMNWASTILVIIFWDILMFDKIFVSPQVKRIMIISNKHGINELPHEFLNNLRFRTLGN